ncbi:hypothetical protein, partial [Slackia piriformis]|uniref:hypothetical protein n=1 Tax=Slackia piriformis TaxID=626934 RepID=UPI002F94B01E
FKEVVNDTLQLSVRFASFQQGHTASFGWIIVVENVRGHSGRDGMDSVSPRTCHAYSRLLSATPTGRLKSGVSD